LHLPDNHDALDVLSKVGGLEIGAIAGTVLAAAAARVPVIIDGVISTAGVAIATDWRRRRARLSSPAIKAWSQGIVYCWIIWTCAR
jgi:NaMN:DMB phosphoribosyltransferase